MYYVICQDGQQRHTDAFSTKAEAQEFAHWGHCCTNSHQIVHMTKTLCSATSSR